MIDAHDFGVVGDGQTDNTAALQKALDTAAKTRSSVFLPEGTYKTSTLRMPPHTGLLGNPNWSFRKTGGSILELNDPAAECLIDLTKAQGATLNGLCIDGQLLGDNVHGIMVNNKEYGDAADENTFRIERCRINDFSGNGAYFRRVWCFSMRHNMISHNGGDGLWLQGWDGFILDNWFTGNGRCGVGAYEKTSAITFTGNRVEWNHSAGLEIRGGNHYNITGNYFDRQGGPGLDIKDRDGSPSYQISAIGNTFFRNGKPSRCIDEPYNSAQVRCQNSTGIILTSNLCEVFRDDSNADSGDGSSPDYGIVYGMLKESIIKDNVLSEGAKKELLVDLGGHKGQVIVKDNVGSLFADVSESAPVSEVEEAELSGVLS